ncbi:MAG: riboflavin synthase, partial [Pyrinomonadaceae bacterium]
MFTGLIEELGRIENIALHKAGAKIRVAASLVTDGTNDGDSIAVNGVCLTALNVADELFEADLSQETIDRSTLGNLKIGTRVNLERAVTPSTRLGGHIVQGHVDTRGILLSAENSGEFWTLTIGFPKEFAKYLVYKGSIAVEGVSLTVAEL